MIKEPGCQIVLIIGAVLFVIGLGCLLWTAFNLQRL